MSYELLEEKIRTVPEEYMGEVSDFIDFIIQKSINESKRNIIKKFIESCPKEPVMTDDEIAAEVNAVRFG